MVIADQAQELVVLANQKSLSDLYFKPISTGWLIYGRKPLYYQLEARLDINDGQAIINYFKFNGQMDLSEHRRPQIGSWYFQIEQLKLNLRMTTVGDYLSRECLVIRLLYNLPSTCAFIEPKRFQALRTSLDQRGLVIFSGPTGSGKTTLMYYLAKQLASTQSVLTIEDPPEIIAPEFTQLQVNNLAQMTYQELLKISLRLRPDILIIGEIRDEMTAAMAMQAALSGHLVLATIHARSCGGVIERLIDLGSSQVTLTNALTACCYQRLLPTTTGDLRVALDLLSATDLAACIKKPQPFQKYWQNDLQSAYNHDQISAEIWTAFQFG